MFADRTFMTTMTKRWSRVMMMLWTMLMLTTTMSIQIRKPILCKVSWSSEYVIHQTINSKTYLGVGLIHSYDNLADRCKIYHGGNYKQSSDNTNTSQELFTFRHIPILSFLCIEWVDHVFRSSNETNISFLFFVSLAGPFCLSMALHLLCVSLSLSLSPSLSLSLTLSLTHSLCSLSFFLLRF